LNEVEGTYPEGRPKERLQVEEIKKLYLVNKLSLSAIGEIYHTHPVTIGERLREIDMEIRKL